MTLHPCKVFLLNFLRVYVAFLNNFVRMYSKETLCLCTRPAWTLIKSFFLKGLVDLTICSRPRCMPLLELLHEQLHCARAHLLLPCRLPRQCIVIEHGTERSQLSNKLDFVALTFFGTPCWKPRVSVPLYEKNPHTVWMQAHKTQFSPPAVICAQSLYP